MKQLIIVILACLFTYCNQTKDDKYYMQVDVSDDTEFKIYPDTASLHILPGRQDLKKGFDVIDSSSAATKYTGIFIHQFGTGDAILLFPEYSPLAFELPDQFDFNNRQPIKSSRNGEDPIIFFYPEQGVTWQQKRLWNNNNDNYHGE